MVKKSKFGSTDDQIRNNFKKAYNDKGIKVLVSFFAIQFRLQLN